MERAVLKMGEKKGVMQEGLMNLLLWIVFIIIAGAAVYFIVQRLST